MNLHSKISYLAFILVVHTVHCDEKAENKCHKLEELVQSLQEQVGVIQGELREIKKEKDATTEDKRFIADGENDLQATVDRLEKDVKNLVEGVGSTYVRWGRTTCPGNTTVVYKGFMGGNIYTADGGPSNYVCLPDDPSWAKYVDGIQNEGNKIYGTEYKNHATSFYPFPQNMYNQDVPCAVCDTKRPQNIMVPARTSCYTGWHLEYTGYLMTIHSSHPAAGEYICMDDHPEAIPHGSASTDGNLLYFVEAVCGTLPCLPYVDGRELACSVCSK